MVLPSKHQVIELGPEHIPQIADLRTSVGWNNPPAQFLRFELFPGSTTSISSPHSYGVFSAPDTLIGMGSLIVNSTEKHGYLGNLCVNPDNQGHGIGTLLIRHMLRVSEKNDLNLVYLHIKNGSTSMLNTYLRLGFSIAYAGDEAMRLEFHRGES